MIELRQSTAGQEVPLGFFVDSTDGDTEETGLTISNTDIWIWKWGATTLANKNSGGATHIQNGVFYCVLDATDTDTLGPLKIFVHESGALTVVLECAVVTANYWDSKYSTDYREVDLTHIMGTILTEGGDGRLKAAFVKLFDVATPLLVASDVMVGTDGANTTTPPTVTEIQAEMEENGASILDSISDLLPGSTIAAATDIPAMVGTDSAALASVCTETRLAELDAANLPTDVAAIPTTAQIATAVMAKTVDGTLDVTEALTVLLAMSTAKEVAVSGSTYTFKDQDGNTKVTITYGATSSTAVIA